MSFESGGPTLPRDTHIDTRMFSNEPLLLRMDLATHAFYRKLENPQDKKVLEIASHVANVSVLLRQATKKELKRYGQPGEQEITRDVRMKYQARQDQVTQPGTFDMQWGLKWLLSFVILLESPVFGTAGAERMVVIAEQWMKALADAGIHEVADQMSELQSILRTARDELPASCALAEQLPGKFSSACSLLFAGQLRDAYVNMYKPKWVVAEETLNSQARGECLSEMSLDEARQLVDDIVPLDAVCISSCPLDIRIDSVGAAGAEDASGLQQYVPVLVRIFDRQKMADREDKEPILLRFGYESLEFLRPGFIIEATLHTLSNGCHYIDAVTMVWPSYSPLDYVELY
ncbi:hypothetical protein LPJ66_006510 [Kickxella alabastrina]|uniref:Uncharacterized protein n=1 Tax=Kickxella alabastrina TaxID=61397 RepID=A0ACC1IDU1_9FUNG|nr:hypothetical protein LPJ66_006510 [Kickxella alabastrina]